MESAQAPTTKSTPRHAQAAGPGIEAISASESAHVNARHAAPGHVRVSPEQNAPRHGGAHARDAISPSDRTSARHAAHAAAEPFVSDGTVPGSPAPEITEARETTVPVSRYRAVVSALVAAVALFALVFAFSPFNPAKMLQSPSADNRKPVAAVQPAKYNESAYADDKKAISEEDAAQLSQLMVNGSAIGEDLMAVIASQTMPYTSQVGSLSQNELGLPSGCEIVSLGVLMQSVGYDVTPNELADDYLVMDGSFSDGYAGSPYGAGGGFPPGIVGAANAYLAANGSSSYAYDLTGSTFEGLKGLLSHGYPVLVWSTMFVEEPMFSGAYDSDREWYDNEHCVVVYGVDDEGVLVSDPIEGYVVRDEAEFARIYDLCGNMAAAVI